MDDVTMLLMSCLISVSSVCLFPIPLPHKALPLIIRAPALRTCCSYNHSVILP